MGAAKRDAAMEALRYLRANLKSAPTGEGGSYAGGKHGSSSSHTPIAHSVGVYDVLISLHIKH
jgi:hypothetical protein